MDAISNGYKECVWYNGYVEPPAYEVLDFDPNNMTPKQVVQKAWGILQDRYSFDNGNKNKVLETLYLLPACSLIKLEV